MSNDDNDINKTLDDWLVAVGEPAKYKDNLSYLRVTKARLPDALKDLVETLLSQKFEEDFIRGNFLLSKIQRILTPPDHKFKKNKSDNERWRLDIGSEWEHQVRVRLGDPTQVKKAEIKEFIPPKGKLDPKTYRAFETNDIVNEDMVKLLEELKNGG